MHLRNSGSKRPQRKVDVPRLRYDFQDHREARQVGPPQGVAHQRKTPSIEKTVEKTPCRLFTSRRYGCHTQWVLTHHAR